MTCHVLSAAAKCRRFALVAAMGSFWQPFNSEVRICAALFSRHDGLGRPCEDATVAFRHADNVYEGLSRIQHNYDSSVVVAALAHVFLEKANTERARHEMSTLSVREDSGTAAAASASADSSAEPLSSPPESQMTE